MKMRHGVLGCLLLVACAFPWSVPNPAVTTIAVFTLLWAASAVAWNMFSGYTGFVSLGHAAFFGVGAYTLALLCQDWQVPGGLLPFLLLPLCALSACVCAALVGWVALRTRGHTFVVVTIALFFSFQLLAFNLRDITNGSVGLNLPTPLWSGEDFNRPFYYAALLLLLLALAVALWVRSSKYGLLLLAIREDEERARSLGVQTGAYTLSAYILSAAFAGVAGGIDAYFVGSIYPQFAFDPTFNVAISLACFVGGVGTQWGPLLGALLLVPLQQYLTLQFGAMGLDQIVDGLLFLFILLVLPEGIIPSLERQWRKRWPSSRTSLPGVEGTAPKAALPTVLCGETRRELREGSER